MRQEPERIKIGLHITDLSSTLSGSDRSTILRGAQRAKLEDVLRRRPIRKLTLLPDIRDPLGDVVNGFYIPSRESITISTARVRGEGFAVPFSWGVVQSISTTASSATLAAQYTFVHELGHHVLKIAAELMGDTLEQHCRMAYLAAIHERRLISIYAGTNWREYFCEVMVGGVFRSNEVKTRDPLGYICIQAVLYQLRAWAMTAK